MNEYKTYYGFENAVWTAATRSNRATSMPSKKALGRIFARCIRSSWAMPAPAVINALLSNTLPRAFKRAPKPARPIAELQAELAIVNAQIAALLTRASVPEFALVE